MTQNSPIVEKWDSINLTRVTPFFYDRRKVGQVIGMGDECIQNATIVEKCDGEK